MSKCSEYDLKSLQHDTAPCPQTPRTETEPKEPLLSHPAKLYFEFHTKFWISILWPCGRQLAIRSKIKVWYISFVSQTPKISWHTNHLLSFSQPSSTSGGGPSNSMKSPSSSNSSPYWAVTEQQWRKTMIQQQEFVEASQLRIEPHLPQNTRVRHHRRLVLWSDAKQRNVHSTSSTNDSSTAFFKKFQRLLRHASFCYALSFAALAACKTGWTCLSCAW